MEISHTDQMNKYMITMYAQLGVKKNYAHLRLIIKENVKLQFLFKLH